MTGTDATNSNHPVPVPSSSSKTVTPLSPPRRRRSRPCYYPAKEAFVVTVQTQVRKLMDESGFGRDRAVAAVLREIAVPEQNPSDTQIFQAMRRYGIGMEQAVMALSVSDALEHAVQQGSTSTRQAVQDLTTKLNTAKFVHLPAQQVSTLLCPPPTTPPLSTPPDLRIAPVPSIERVVLPRNSSSNSKVVPTKKSKAANKMAKPASRKRSMDDNQESAQQQEQRPRADSVTEIVTAKISSEKTAVAATTGSDEKKVAPHVAGAVVQTPVLRNNKRRGDDGSAEASAHKRSRTNAA